MLHCNVRRVLAFVGAAAFSAVSFAAAPASDWNRFRGPNGSGVAANANTPTSFTEKDFNWRIELPGQGHSSPVVSGSKVFVTAGDTESGKRGVVCIDLDTGKTLWKRDFDSRNFAQHKDNSLASASPTADAERVYFTFTTPESYKVYCLDHSGSEQWTYDMGPWQSQHGAGCSPIVHDGMLIVPNDQDGPTASLVALDAKTGQLKWKIDRKPGPAAAATPCIFQPKSGQAQLIMNSTSSGLTSIDPLTGKQNWSQAWPSPNASRLRAVASPVATDTLCVGTSGQGGADRTGAVVQPSATTTEAPTLLHKIPAGATSAYVPTPVIVGDLMFIWADAATVNCVKATTGEQVWQQKIPATGKGRIEFYSSPIVAGNKLYNISKEGEVICLSATDKFELLGRSALNQKCHATMAVAGNSLLVRTVSHLISVGK